MHVFADQRDAKAAHANEDNPNYLGTRYFFGHGVCGGAEGHCDPVPRDIYDLRPKHHYEPVRIRLNVTKRLKRLIAPGAGATSSNPSGNAPITLVVVDRKGNGSRTAACISRGSRSSFADMRIKSGETVATFSFDRIEPDFRRAEVRFEGLTPPVPSFAVRVFVDEPHANAHTPTDGNPHYLGTQHFFGLGVADQPPDPGDAFRLGRASQSAPTQVPLNVTAGLRAYVAQTTPHDAPITLVAVDRDGNEIAEPDLDLEGVSLVTT